MGYEAERLEYLKDKYGIEKGKLELDGGPRHTLIQKTAQEWVDDRERAETEATKRHLAFGSVKYHGKLLRLWADIVPDR